MIPLGYSICIGLTVLSTLLYLWIIVLIIYKRNEDPYDSAFFKIWLALAFADIAEMMNTFVLSDALVFGYFRSLYESSASSALAMLDRSIGKLFYHAQILINLMLAINRYTAIVMPIKHNLIWTNKSVYLLLTGLFALCLLTIVPCFCTSYTIVWNNATSNFNELLGDTNILSITEFVSSIVGVISIAIGLYCYSIAIFKYRQLQLQTSESRQQTTTTISIKTEFRFLMCGLSTFIAMILNVVCDILDLGIILGGNLYSPFEINVYTAWSYFIPLLCMLSPWTLLLCSKNVQQSLFGGIWTKLKLLFSKNSVNSAVQNDVIFY